MRFALAFLPLLYLAVAAPHAQADRTGSGLAPYVVHGHGIVTDASHPNRPGDFRSYDLQVEIRVNPQLGEAMLMFESGTGESKSTDRYYIRRGRAFQADDKGTETIAENLGDLTAATVAALHPALVETALGERPENLQADKRHGTFAWNDELWSVEFGTRPREIRGLARRTVHDLYGDGTETLRYDGWSEGPTGAGQVTVTHRGRVTSRIDFEAAVPDSAPASLPDAERQRDRTRLVAPAEIILQETAPHLYRIDFAGLNTRVHVVEFADHVAVLEGAYTSRICDRIADAVQAKLGKPVRWFAFSHLHGQYVGGVRSWVHAGATVLVPPTTAPMIQDVVRARFELRPDALAREPKPLHLETVATSRIFEDALNSLQVFNVESGHTDEYFLFWLPRQKVLLTGDLLFCRPGKPLTGRSKLLVETVRKLGLDPDTYVATWPLEGFGTKSICTRDDIRAAMDAGAAAP